MASKIAKKARAKVTQEKSIPKQGKLSWGVKWPCSTQRPPVSPASKKSKKKQSVSAEDQFDTTKFVDVQAARLYKALGKAKTSDSKVFDFRSLHECGLELIEAFNKYGIRRFCMVRDDF